MNKRLVWDIAPKGKPSPAAELLTAAGLTCANCDNIALENNKSLCWSCYLNQSLAEMTAAVVKSCNAKMAEEFLRATNGRSR